MTSAAGIRFPLFRTVEIDGYALYPGEAGEGGLHAQIHPGVNLIVGVNGLGKTTLLSALFRVLSGPREWSKRKVDRPAGTTSTELGGWSNRAFFRERVPDRARAAKITAEITFGEDLVRLTRRLANLELTEFSLNGRRHPTDSYEAQIAELAGVSSFEDFFVFLRYLFFYLETRQPVIWDPAAQFDLMRVLFLDTEMSTSIRRGAAEVQRLDSLVRNRNWQVAQDREKLKELRARIPTEPVTSVELEGLRTQAEGAQEEERRLVRELRAADELYRSERLTHEREKIRLLELTRLYEIEEQGFFASLFPDTPEIVRYLTVHVASGNGCLLCGSRTERAAEHVRNALEAETCPVCESPAAEQEAVVPASTVSKKRMEKLEAEIRELREHVTAVRQAVDHASSLRASLHESLWRVREQGEEAQREYERLSGFRPEDQDRLETLELLIHKGLAEVKRDEEKFRTEAQRLRTKLEAAEARVEALARSIVDRFGFYASLFLAETCYLEYEVEHRHLGQRTASKPFPFPRFTPFLTSGGFGHTPQRRSSATDVSESQKEFIDLAFRMALIDVAGGGQPGLLVVETPEASLDAAFIVRAGHMLAEFANAPAGHQLVASTNLNQSHMISVLFGVLKEHEREMLATPMSHVVPSDERASRVTDLLRIARPTAALQLLRTQYEKELDIALYPEKYPTAVPDTAPS